MLSYFPPAFMEPYNVASTVVASKNLQLRVLNRTWISVKKKNDKYKCEFCRLILLQLNQPRFPFFPFPLLSAPNSLTAELFCTLPVVGDSLSVRKLRGPPLHRRTHWSGVIKKGRKKKKRGRSLASTLVSGFWSNNVSWYGCSTSSDTACRGLVSSCKAAFWSFFFPSSPSSFPPSSS